MTAVALAVGTGSARAAATAVTLQPDGFFPGRFAMAATAAAAVPAALGGDGASFSVAWQAAEQ